MKGLPTELGGSEGLGEAVGGSILGGSPSLLPERLGAWSGRGSTAPRPPVAPRGLCRGATLVTASAPGRGELGAMAGACLTGVAGRGAFSLGGSSVEEGGEEEGREDRGGTGRWCRFWMGHFFEPLIWNAKVATWNRD